MVVNIFGNRHGQTNESGAMSEFGERQVIASAETHLANIRFHLAVHSGIPRAQRTVELILGHNEFPTQPRPYAHPLFSFVTYGSPTSAVEIKALQAELEGKNLTVEEWMRRWPHAAETRPRIQAAFKAFVLDITAMISHGDVNVLMGGHSPLTELGVPHPETFPRLQYADLVHYMFQVDRGEVHVIGANYYPCPLPVAT